MAYKLYQKLISAMANEGVCNASDVDMSASVNGQSYSKVGAIINAIISFVTSLVSTSLKREIVQALPTTNISNTTIYLMLKDPAGASGDIYDEYMYINNNWEHIGSTEVDLSNYVQKPSDTSDNKQYVMRNGAWDEADAAGVTYSGDVSGVANVKAAIDALVPYATLAQQLKAAMGNEVGNVWPRAFSIGELAWHGGKLYRVTNATVVDDPWDAFDVAETTLSDELNSLRGLSVESVYLTIQPTSAIPQAGVTARIYNIKTQTYMAEETITPSANRVHLGDVPFGDDYTIIMPSIDGYTKPADQTFKASQMIRERTVIYTASEQSQVELIQCRISPTTLAVGNIVVTTYNDAGTTVTGTYNLAVTQGVSESISLPLGTKYRVTFPSVSGYITPSNATTYHTASVSNKYYKGVYVAQLPNANYQWVIKVGNTLEYLDYEQDIEEYINDGTLFGLAYLNSDLVRTDEAGGDCRFIYVFGQSAGDKNRGVWSNPAVDVPDVQPLNNNWENSTNDVLGAKFNGRSNTALILDAIEQYENDNDTTVTSIFKTVVNKSSGIISNGSEVKYFVASWFQAHRSQVPANNVQSIFTRYNAATKFAKYTMPRDNSTIGISAQRSASNTATYYDGYTSGNAKSSTSNYCVLLPLITVFDSQD